MSRKKFAKASKINVKIINAIENGEQQYVYANTLVKLAKFAGIRDDAVVERFAPTPNRQRLLIEIRALLKADTNLAKRSIQDFVRELERMEEQGVEAPRPDSRQLT